MINNTLIDAHMVEADACILLRCIPAAVACHTYVCSRDNRQELDSAHSPQGSPKGKHAYPMGNAALCYHGEQPTALALTFPSHEACPPAKLRAQFFLFHLL